MKERCRTLSISEPEKKKTLRAAAAYACAAALTGVFAFIYSRFSHGVYSAAMTCAFLYPAVSALLLLLPLIGLKAPGRLEFNLFSAAVSTLTVGSIVQGVIKIAGYDSRIYILYYVLGALLLAAALVSRIASAVGRRREKK